MRKLYSGEDPHNLPYSKCPACWPRKVVIKVKTYFGIQLVNFKLVYIFSLLPSRDNPSRSNMKFSPSNIWKHHKPDIPSYFLGIYCLQHRVEVLLSRFWTGGGLSSQVTSLSPRKVYFLSALVLSFWRLVPFFVSVFRHYEPFYLKVSDFIFEISLNFNHKCPGSHGVICAKMENTVKMTE